MPWTMLKVNSDVKEEFERENVSICGRRIEPSVNHAPATKSNNDNNYRNNYYDNNYNVFNI